MSDRDTAIEEAEPFRLVLEEAFERLKKYGTVEPDSGFMSQVRRGEWKGPGRYFLLQYCQPCPKGCCHDSVNEVLTEEDYRQEVQGLIDRRTQDLKSLKSLIEDTE